MAQLCITLTLSKSEVVHYKRNGKTHKVPLVRTNITPCGQDQSLNWSTVNTIYERSFSRQEVDTFLANEIL